jgi:hypothetical protein
MAQPALSSDLPDLLGQAMVNTCQRENPYG